MRQYYVHTANNHFHAGEIIPLRNIQCLSRSNRRPREGHHNLEYA